MLRVTTPFSRLGARKRAQGLPADRLPPGQYLPRGWPVLHYGPVPKPAPAGWDLRVFGATASGRPTTWDAAGFAGLPRTEVTADFHCVTKFSLLDSTWTGVSTSVLLELAPPAVDVTHVMVWAEYGYSANMALADFADAAALFVTHRNSEPLSAEHGAPLRLVVPHLYAWKGPKWARGVEYLTEDRRGFWEERGYHNLADPWQEQRYSYQEAPGDGPE
ncbi:MAG: sulfite oxidase-like oxidoreductase [Frankiales bacterium]|jgi:DMSO/TMAO reductase YedYZ molybdopterin-dependent catalytic subunit|nr:sulfite oxidase-like oxidoreductase [Frankiales bacterium]